MANQFPQDIRAALDKLIEYGAQGDEAHQLDTFGMAIAPEILDAQLIAASRLLASTINRDYAPKDILWEAWYQNTWPIEEYYVRAIGNYYNMEHEVKTIDGIETKVWSRSVPESRDNPTQFIHITRDNTMYVNEYPEDIKAALDEALEYPKASPNEVVAYRQGTLLFDAQVIPEWAQTIADSMKRASGVPVLSPLAILESIWSGESRVLGLYIEVEMSFFFNCATIKKTDVNGRIVCSDGVNRYVCMRKWERVFPGPEIVGVDAVENE